MLHAESEGVAKNKVCMQTGGMKTETAIKRAGNKSALARLLVITRQSIQKWGEDVPPKQEAKLRKDRPDWFRSKKA